MISNRKYNNAVLKVLELLEMYENDEELQKCYAECSFLGINNSKRRKKIVNDYHYYQKKINDIKNMRH